MQVRCFRCPFPTTVDHVIWYLYDVDLPHTQQLGLHFGLLGLRSLLSSSPRPKTGMRPNRPQRQWDRGKGQVRAVFDFVINSFHELLGKSKPCMLYRRRRSEVRRCCLELGSDPAELSGLPPPPRGQCCRSLASLDLLPSARLVFGYAVIYIGEALLTLPTNPSTQMPHQCTHECADGEVYELDSSFVRSTERSSWAGMSRDDISRLFFRSKSFLCMFFFLDMNM